MDLKQVVELARKMMAAMTGPLEPGPLPGTSSAAGTGLVAAAELGSELWEVGAATAGAGAAASQLKPLKCFFCAEEGHVVRLCPKKQMRKARREAATGLGNGAGLW